MAVRCSKNARVSTQKSHTGRKNGEKAVKNSTPPPTAPSSRYSRSCPCARRSMKRKTAKPAAMQYRMSSADVRRGSRRRQARSRSYSSAAAMPSRIA